MIRDEAVEAAAKALHDLGVYAKAWDERNGELRELYREDARAALEAAAPYMQQFPPPPTEPFQPHSHTG